MSTPAETTFAVWKPTHRGDSAPPETGPYSGLRGRIINPPGTTRRRIESRRCLRAGKTPPPAARSRHLGSCASHWWIDAGGSQRRCVNTSCDRHQRAQLQYGNRAVATLRWSSGETGGGALAGESAEDLLRPLVPWLGADTQVAGYASTASVTLGLAVVGVLIALSVMSRDAGRADERCRADLRRSRDAHD
jgi:hypothetical protein